jgi:UDPglucose 6-dehydrogenase
MNICVAGLWHLGAVTSACLASFGHRVVGLDADPIVIARCRQGYAPVYEPGLDELIGNQLISGHLEFTTDAAAACADCDALWIAYDTPVNEEDHADTEFVLTNVKLLLPKLKSRSLVLVSSQLPVGSMRQLEQFAEKHFSNKTFEFVCIPENLRLGKAIEVFCNPDRVVVGIRSDSVKLAIQKIYDKITDNIEWTSVESAEMVKHATNAFLALSVTFANEIATICESVGADAKEVERALKKDSRIGLKAYLAPGGPFAGGTLARDIEYLLQASRRSELPSLLLAAVRQSNDQHKKWVTRKLDQYFPSLHGVPVALWGLTYKAGTDTLRRSVAIELCEWLIKNEAIVHVHDPAVKQLPEFLLNRVIFHESAQSAAYAARVLIISTEWPEYKAEATKLMLAVGQRLVVIDANRHIVGSIDTGACDYVAVGTSNATRLL